MRLKSLQFSITCSAIFLYIGIIIGSQFVNLSFAESSKILNLSNGIINSTFPQIKTFNHNFILVFWTGDANHGVNNEIQSDIFLAKSENKGISFKDPINISNNTGSSFNPQSEVSSNIIYVVWEDDTFARSYDLLDTNTSILFKQSKDNGNTFSSPVFLSFNNTDSTNPDITTAVNDNNAVYVVWQDNSDKSSKILFKKNTSNNNNTIFSNQQIISNNEGDNYEISPQIAAYNNTIDVMWNSFNVKDDTSTILIRNSINDGNSFGKTIFLNNNDSSKFATNSIIKMYDNDVYVVWQEQIKDQFDVFLTKSSDDGITFNEPINLSDDSGDSINPNLIVLHNNLHVIWNDNNTKKDNIMIKSSSDGGITFNEPINLSTTTNSNSINPQLAATADELFVVWQEQIKDQFDVFLTKSSDDGITFNEPINLSTTTNSNSINPQLAATADELFVVWQEDISGNNQIYFTSIDTI
ncbi:MAG: sialidase family protein [Nitrososphaeraceae archaeon]